MKFSSRDKISETVSLIRNKKIYFIGRNKYIIILKKIECWPVFKQDPNNLIYPKIILLTPDGGGVADRHAHGAGGGQEVGAPLLVLDGAFDEPDELAEHRGHDAGHVHHRALLAQGEPCAYDCRQANDLHTVFILFFFLTICTGFLFFFIFFF